MMTPGQLEMIAQARREELARHMRQIGFGEAGQVEQGKGWQPIYQALVYWVGMRLVTLGIKLQGHRPRVGVSVAAAGLPADCCQEGC